jgi:hypothetical protein
MMPRQCQQLNQGTLTQMKLGPYHTISNGSWLLGEQLGLDLLPRAGYFLRQDNLRIALAIHSRRPRRMTGG